MMRFIIFQAFWIKLLDPSVIITDIFWELICEELVKPTPFEINALDYSKPNGNSTEILAII